MKLRLLCLLTLILTACIPASAADTKSPKGTRDERVVGIGVAIQVEGLSKMAPEKFVRVSKYHPLRVIELMKESPSIAAGLKVGDVITRVDDVDIDGLALKDIVARIRGKENTKVKITFIRANEKEPRTITVERKPLSYAATKKL
ncbi:MAG: PDZ domain-containing protein [Candidatus Obscuribacterales bacterium]|nr:PDZ domain-containing protein [Candidatus Obscuribacterales bacterium]